jgi:hypothetical protein
MRGLGCWSQAPAMQYCGSGPWLRIDLALLDLDRIGNSAPHPEPGARKRTKFNKITLIPPFKKAVVPVTLCVMTYKKCIFHFLKISFMPGKSDQDPDPDPRIGRKAGSGSGSALKQMRIQTLQQRRHSMIFFNHSLSPST